MILCCGEALIDMIPTPVDGAAVGFVPHAGGHAGASSYAIGFIKGALRAAQFELKLACSAARL